MTDTRLAALIVLATLSTALPTAPLLAQTPKTPETRVMGWPERAGTGTAGLILFAGGVAGQILGFGGMISGAASLLGTAPTVAGVAGSVFLLMGASMFRRYSEDVAVRGLRKIGEAFSGKTESPLLFSGDMFLGGASGTAAGVVAVGPGALVAAIGTAGYFGYRYIDGWVSGSNVPRTADTNPKSSAASPSGSGVGTAR